MKAGRRSRARTCLLDELGVDDHVVARGAREVLNETEHQGLLSDAAATAVTLANLAHDNAVVEEEHCGFEVFEQDLGIFEIHTTLGRAALIVATDHDHIYTTTPLFDLVDVPEEFVHEIHTWRPGTVVRDDVTGASQERRGAGHTVVVKEDDVATQAGADRRAGDLLARPVIEPGVDAFDEDTGRGHAVISDGLSRSDVIEK